MISLADEADRAASLRLVRGNSWRLFITVWLIASVHATTNVVRETYLAIALGGYATIRVDRYLGLHPDLFEIPGRGAYINSNPGASILGAAVYAFVHPVIELAVKIKPSIAAPKPPARYDDPRANRTRFMNRSRARGLDIVLGLAAIGIAVLLMAPLAGLASVVMYRALRERLEHDRAAIVWALVYVFATPILFRSAFLNQNVILAHCVLGAWLALTGRSFFLAGLLLGVGLLSDYSALPFVLVFGVWILWEGLRAEGRGSAIGWTSRYVAGISIPVMVLFGYQWMAFGHPLLPAQHYMPPTKFSIMGWSGFTLPTRELLWGNLFDLRYGLFAFCPLLLAAFAAPFVRLMKGAPSNKELGYIFASFVALYLFSSANQFANLQWNTGVRYMVPAIPLLFLAAVPVLRRMPRLASAFLVGISLVISLAVTMTREDIPTALGILMSSGPTLPILLVLKKMESGYASIPTPWFTLWVAYGIIGGLLWFVWRRNPHGPVIG